MSCDVLVYTTTGRSLPLNTRIRVTVYCIALCVCVFEVLRYGIKWKGTLLVTSSRITGNTHKNIYVQLLSVSITVTAYILYNYKSRN